MSGQVPNTAQLWNRRSLNDGETVMQRLIVAIAEAYEATAYTEATQNNADAWIGDLWDCYHPYGNYGSYCMVGASAMLNGASQLARQFGGADCREKMIPFRPATGSPNREGTLYGNVYDTLNELANSDPDLIDNTPAVGALFMRPSDNGRTNHAGIVVSANLTDDDYIETIEANVSTSGYGGSAKGFQRVRYSKAGYDDFGARDWILSARASAYGNFRPRGWYFFHGYQLCQADAVTYQGDLCLGVQVSVDLRPDAPAEPESQIPTVTEQPAPMDCQGAPPPPESGYTQWRSVAEILAEIQDDPSSPVKITSKKGTGESYLLPSTSKYPTAGREFTLDGCWVRWQLSEVSTEVAKEINRGDTRCPEGLITRSCCEGGATTITLPTASQMLTLMDMRQKGGREALMTSAINPDELARRGYGTRYSTIGQMWPMVRTQNGKAVTVLSVSSFEYKVAEELSIWGPNPAFIEIDRTQISGGVGGGWAERVAEGFEPGVALETTGNVIRRDDLKITDGLLRQKTGGTQIGGGISIGSADYTLQLFEILERIDTNGDAIGNRQPVIVFTGEPKTALSVVAGLSSIIGAGINIVIPGAGSLISGALQIAQEAYTRGNLQVQDAFSFLGYLGSGLSNLASNNSDGKVFGVNADVFADIARYSTTSNNIYGILRSNANAVQASYAIISELQTNVPELTDALRSEFADEEKWIRGAFADINDAVSGALSDARMAINNVSDGLATNIIGNLRELSGGVDSVFADLLTGSGTGITKTSTKIPLVQDLLTGAPHPSMLNTRAGAQDLFSRILSLPATFATDVTDATIHSAIAGIVTGRGMVEGAMDQMTLDALLHKAEDFARNEWKFDVPPTIPEDKRECFEREIAVCIGQRCCPPLVMVGETCQPQVATTTKKPSGVIENADCLRQDGTELMWCRPAECDGGDDRYETATIMLRSDSGTPYEITATRRRGTSLWTDFRVLVWEPIIGTSDYQRPTTIPIDAVRAGVEITSEDFENIRIELDAPIKETVSPSGTTNEGECTSIHPARISADGSGRVLVDIGGVWQVLNGCCPETYVPQTTTTGGDGCCEEVSVLGSKIDSLAGAIRDITMEWRNWSSQQLTQQSTPIDGSSISITTQPQEPYQLPPGVAPLRPCCDLSPILAILEELPGVIGNVDTVGGTYTPLDPALVIESGTTTTRTPEELADIKTLQTSLVRIEEAIKLIEPGSPCDNSDILSMLVTIQAMLERTTVGYDDTLVQQKLDRILSALATDTTTDANTVIERLSRIEELIQTTTTASGGCDLSAVLEAIKNIQIPQCTTLDAESIMVMLTRIQERLAEQNTNSDANTERIIREITSHIDTRTTVTNTATDTATAEKLERVLGELTQTRIEYQTVIDELRTFIDRGVVVCDTETLRQEIATQTQTIRELRTLIEAGNSVDTTVIEQELQRQAELLRVIIERISTGSIVTTPGTTTDKEVVTTIVQCDDTELQTALSELRQMMQLVPVIQQELRTFQSATESALRELRSELAVAVQILRDLQARTTTTTDSGSVQTFTTDNSEILRELYAQRALVQTLVERYSEVTNGGCDLSEVRLILTSLQETQTEMRSQIAEILDRLSRTATSSEGGTSVVVDTELVRQAVREAVTDSVSSIQTTLQRLTERIEGGEFVREVSVNTDSLERKLDEVLDRLRSMQSYDNTELLQRINELSQSRSDQVILDKLDLLLSQTNDPGEREQIEAVRENVQTRTQTPGIDPDCPDCPAYVEEHRKVFYRYPTTVEATATERMSQQAQPQTAPAPASPPPTSGWSQTPEVEIIPIQMPCTNC